LCLSAALASAVRAAPENIDPASDGHQFAWSENGGWINAEPQGDGGPGVSVSDSSLSGWMWGENLGWISLSCANTGTCGTNAYGVVNNGFGVLSGFAWSENGGWINFSPTACLPSPDCGVRIDPATGYFSGRSWGENVGWITFASAGPISSTARTNWCGTTAAPPVAGPVILLGRVGQELALSYGALAGASWYDVVAGDLTTLRASGGDFAQATVQCLRAKFTGTSFNFTTPVPVPGAGQWFIVRGANCRGRGTYDLGPRQVGARDAEIAASGHDCP
jgi:hypothetical protein